MRGKICERPFAASEVRSVHECWRTLDRTNKCERCNTKQCLIQFVTYARHPVSGGVLDTRLFVQSLSPDVRLQWLRPVVAASIEHALSVNDVRLCTETMQMQLVNGQVVCFIDVRYKGGAFIKPCKYVIAELRETDKQSVRVCIYVNIRHTLISVGSLLALTQTWRARGRVDTWVA